MRSKKCIPMLMFFMALCLLFSFALTAFADDLPTMTATIQPYENLIYSGKPQPLLDAETFSAIKDGQPVAAEITFSSKKNCPYGPDQPVFTDAGTYTVYYQIQAEGYETISGHHTVTIAPKPVSVTWSLEGDFTGDGDRFSRTYNGTSFSLPTAMIGSDSVTVSLLSGTDGAYTAVGNYVFEAQNANYAITNPTCTVSILGQESTGFALEPNTDVWYDGKFHVPAVLTVGTPSDATVTYCWSDNGGAAWKEENLSQMPTFKESGTYLLRADITKDGYEPLCLTTSFTIRSARFQVERSDFVTGWDLILVYTNDEGVTFTYDGMTMYDVSALDYRLNGKSYTYIYGFLVRGTANTTKVVSDNGTAGLLPYDPGSPYDVNGSGSIDLNDLVAVQGIYNVREEMFMYHMEIALKADTNRDKKVDTLDAAEIKSHSESE